ncbi:unnamed protein product [Schistosoma rodhaini]|uniref:Uncharacterized protein n=1 Tax=Schistosoma rodhaini TaxID=6188 RepID=A0AA85FV23_9TREM|nr:unnamed protein product [Schistosoma rodhaini]CAH8568083.1 unnamed protein product [Schistosoma rodhaini]
MIDNKPSKHINTTITTTTTTIGTGTTTPVTTTTIDNKKNTTNYIHLTKPEMLSSMNNKFIELPLIASYSNAFLETIAEETSELETSDNGTFNNELYDIDQISYCTDTELKICENDFTSNYPTIMINDNNNNNTLDKFKQHDLLLEHHNNNTNNNSNNNGVKINNGNKQLCDFWTINLPVTLDNQKTFLNDNKLQKNLSNEMNSSIRNEFFKIVTTTTTNTTATTTNTTDSNNNGMSNNNNGNNDGTFQRLDRIHEEFKENKKGFMMNKVNRIHKDFSLPLWNDEITDEELLILSTDYGKNQLCWTLTSNQPTMTSSLGYHKLNKNVKHLNDTENIPEYSVMYESGNFKCTSNGNTKDISSQLIKDSFIPENTVDLFRQPSNSSQNLSSFHPFVSVSNTNNICKTLIQNSTKPQFPNLCVQPMKSVESSFTSSNFSTQNFTNHYPIFNENPHKTSNDSFIENPIFFQFMPNMVTTSNDVMKGHHKDFYKNMVKQKPLCTGCTSSFSNQSVRPLIPNYTSTNILQDCDNKHEDNRLLIASHISHDGSYLPSSLSKNSTDHRSSIKGLYDNSNTLNQTQQSRLLDRHTTSQINNYPLSQTNNHTSLSTFKTVSRDFSYTLSATNNDFNYSIYVTPENPSEKYYKEEKDDIHSKVGPLQTNFSTSSSSSLCHQYKKCKDKTDSLPPVILYEEELNSNEMTFNNQPITYHHVKSPDFKPIDYSKLFSYSYQQSPLILNKNELNESKISSTNFNCPANIKLSNENPKKQDDQTFENLEMSTVKISNPNEKFSSKPSNLVQQSNYSESLKTKLNNNINSLFRPLQRSPAVVGVSDLLIKSDAELSSILEKVKNGQQSNCSISDSQGVLNQTISNDDSSPDKNIKSGGANSNSYHDDLSPARRRFFPQYLSRDMKLNNSTGIYCQNSDDMEEKRSFYDYGCDDEEDDDKLDDDEENDDNNYPCQSDILIQNKQIYNDQILPYSKYVDKNNSTVIQRIRDLELQNQTYRWEDDCSHSTDKYNSLSKNITNNQTNYSTNNTINERQVERNEIKTDSINKGKELLSSYECEDNDVPYIDSDSLVLEYTHLKDFFPRIADLEEITLSSRRNSVGSSSWLGFCQMDNHKFDQNQSTNELIPSKITIEHEKHEYAPIRRRRDYHSYDSSTQCRNKRRQKMWFQKLCGCVQASRSH